ncbi:acyl carrier protein [Kitasatospora sp. NPDC058218]|uniref:acyl carrier protein n=1 Tax=Kitasatospora sp. NPDC058218 TaxID=3346385 RepID=UPI0036DE0266
MSVDTTSAAGAVPSGAERSDADPSAPGIDSLVAVFRRVLETPDVAADSDFFRLGGDSLIATRVLSAIARDHGVELSFDDFLLAPTPRALAEKIAADR